MFFNDSKKNYFQLKYTEKTDYIDKAMNERKRKNHWPTTIQSSHTSIH